MSTNTAHRLLLAIVIIAAVFAVIERYKATTPPLRKIHTIISESH